MKNSLENRSFDVQNRDNRKRFRKKKVKVFFLSPRIANSYQLFRR